MLALKRLHWNIGLLLGFLFFWIGSVSMLGFFADPVIVPTFDLSSMLAGLVGSIPAFFLLSIVFGASFVLLFEISVFRLIDRLLRHTADSVKTAAERAVESAVSARASANKDGAKPISPKKSDSDKDDRKDGQESRMRDLEREIESLKQAKVQISSTKTETKVPEKIAVTVKKVSDGGVLSRMLGTGVPERAGGESENVRPTSEESIESVEGGSRPLPDFGVWEFPSVDLLDQASERYEVDMNEVRKKSFEIERALLQFKIEVEMEGQKVGPTVIQYRLKPAEGIKLSRIEALKKDLTLALKAKSIRIQAPIPGLGLVGVEVPNDHRDTVHIREILEHPNFRNHKSNLALVIGKDINGDYVVGDLAKMPHLLIAGQTGSGKSVGMNGFLMSLLYKNSPSDLRMIMIDPKRVELGIYNGIPHLLTPVINDPDKALNALKWGVGEMLRRYDLLQKMRVRNLAEYNAKVDRKSRMPNIVIVIDELADLMMSGNKKEVETTIARIAQMARAVGMHLIIATQRPSVDVITGLIKANVPSRIAFTVASLVDSRTVLDRGGAEDLLGYGDMLYSPSGSPAPERIQGVLVTTEETEGVVNHIRRTIDPAMLEELYDASIVEGEKTGSSGAGEDGEYDEDPEVVEQAVKLVRESGKASTTMLQRRLRLGYARAARMMDILEGMGVVGPADGSKPREVL